MPGMPFHLEKGHGLMALEDLINNPAHRAVLTVARDEMCEGTPMSDVFATVVSNAPTLANYGNNPHTAALGGLGPFVADKWFGKPGYWLDYTGDVDGVVRTTLLFALEAASGVECGTPLPEGPFDRRVELLWHCGQRWFEAWVGWNDPSDAVSVLFATPPHAFGEVISSVLNAGPGQATSITASGADPNRDMILITEDAHVERPTIGLGFWPTGKTKIPLPSIGRAFDGSGPVHAWRIHANSGGVHPETVFK